MATPPKLTHANSMEAFLAVSMPHLSIDDPLPPSDFSGTEAREPLSDVQNHRPRRTMVRSDHSFQYLWSKGRKSSRTAKPVVPAGESTAEEDGGTSGDSDQDAVPQPTFHQGATARTRAKFNRDDMWEDQENHSTDTDADHDAMSSATPPRQLQYTNTMRSKPDAQMKPNATSMRSQPKGKGKAKARGGSSYAHDLANVVPALDSGDELEFIRETKADEIEFIRETKAASAPTLVFNSASPAKKRKQPARDLDNISSDIEYKSHQTPSPSPPVKRRRLLKKAELNSSNDGQLGALREANKPAAPPVRRRRLLKKAELNSSNDGQLGALREANEAKQPSSPIKRPSLREILNAKFKSNKDDPLEALRQSKAIFKANAPASASTLPSKKRKKPSDSESDGTDDDFIGAATPPPPPPSKSQGKRQKR